MQLSDRYYDNMFLVFYKSFYCLFTIFSKINIALVLLVCVPKMFAIEEHIPEESYPLDPSTISTVPKNDDLESFRLPENEVIPLEYDLFFEPDLENFTFIGKTAIIARANIQTNYIILHSHKLEYDFIKVETKGVKILEVIEGFDIEKQFMTLNLSQSIRPGQNFTMTFHYSGIINDANRGFYRASYINKQGEEKYCM